ncbi:MAG: VCBS repeat-containing protein, partial [Pseudomonadota bacterium]
GHRWLAPVAAADLDGDGAVEIAYIDRPHLAKTLRVWRYLPQGLEHVADLQGLTNHKFGWEFIAGGLRDCGGPPELILASADWQRIMAVRLHNEELATDAIGPFTGLESIETAMVCRS